MSVTAKIDTAPETAFCEEEDSVPSGPAQSGSPLRGSRNPSPLDRARRAVAYADMPMPEDLPDRLGFAAGVPAGLRAVCAAELSSPDIRFRDTITALKDLLPRASGVDAARIAFMIDTGQACDIDSHDHFFRIRRSAGSAPVAFLASQIRTLHVLQTELKSTPTTLDPARLVAMADAIRGTIAFAVGIEAPAGAALAITGTAPTSEADGSISRWVRGHQIFAALSQGLIFTLAALEQAERDDDAGTVSLTAGLVIELLHASATALELTGDFPAARYNASIRISMDTPYFPAGFSGVLSRDHRQLVGRMKMMRPAIEAFERRDPGLHARIGVALSAVYASHKHVCARFVEPDAASLLMAATAERPATEQIDRFRKMRLRAWQTTSGDTPSRDDEA